MTASTFLRCLVTFFCVALLSCQAATPEKCFDVAVLNSNMLAGFADNGLRRQLESPSMKMGKTKDEVLSIKRTEVIDDKIKFTEENLAKLKSFSQNDDNKDIVQASLALHQYILPVYKTEYTQLAKSFDGGASKEQATQQAQAIHDKYFPKFETLYNRLIAYGKVYAEKHHIDVRWAM